MADGLEHDPLYQKGLKVFYRQFGKEVADAHLKHLEKISEAFARVNIEFPFGELYSRDVLDAKTRELCTLAALTVQGFSLPELALHIEAALHCGASKEEILEVILQMIAYCGFPATTNALFTAEKIFAEHEARRGEGPQNAEGA